MSKKEYLHRKLEHNIYDCDAPCKKPVIQMLLGRGDLNANIMLVGIGPNISYNGMGGRSVFGDYGKSGRKVEKILQLIATKAENKKIKEKSSFWLTNIIKCGCPKTEFSQVMSRCKKFLDEEIAIINPKIIVLFGGKVIKHVLREKMKHGKVTLLDKKYYIHSYHPSPLSLLHEAEIQLLADIIVNKLQM